ncbi:MAG: winged helix DNA-binding domain-containing protein [Chloroflexi bacterium]|nr:winged helix DNA-binding domain-containing protein [Chloroflexota bacterium]
MAKLLVLSRDLILAHRRRVGALETRLPSAADSLKDAAWTGLSDSMPRAAVLSVHARVTGTEPMAWEDQAFVQTWGPRFSAYVIAAADRAIFTLGRLPDDPAGLRRAVTTADRLEAFLDGRRMPFGEAGRGIGIQPNALRYAAPTGRVLIRWDGARQPTIWTVPPPDVDPRDARRELLRRFLHVSGPATAASFGSWAGIKPKRATAIVDDLADELTGARTPIGDAWILTADERSFRDGTTTTPDPASVRLLPSGDAYTLHQGTERELLVPDAAQRSTLWTPRVWPGSVLVGGEIAGVWRRADAKVTIEPWRKVTTPERDAVEAEAASLPLPGVTGIRVVWDA